MTFWRFSESIFSISVKPENIGIGSAPLKKVPALYSAYQSGFSFWKVSDSQFAFKAGTRPQTTEPSHASWTSGWVQKSTYCIAWGLKVERVVTIKPRVVVIISEAGVKLPLGLSGWGKTVDPHWNFGLLLWAKAPIQDMQFHIAP